MAYGSVPEVNCKELKIENTVNATGAANVNPLDLKVNSTRGIHMNDIQDYLLLCAYG